MVDWTTIVIVLPTLVVAYVVFGIAGFGFTPDAKFDLVGFDNALALRAEIEGGKPAAPERYIDLGYYERAMKLVGR